MTLADQNRDSGWAPLVFRGFIEGDGGLLLPLESPRGRLLADRLAGRLLPIVAPSPASGPAGRTASAAPRGGGVGNAPTIEAVLVTGLTTVAENPILEAEG